MEEKSHLNLPEEELKDSVTSFSTLNQIIQQLRSAYQELEDKFEKLTLELEQTNLELKQSLVEKEKISGHLNDILDNLTSGVVTIDLNDNITLFNRVAEEILGYREEEVMGKPYLEIMGRKVEEKLTLPFILKSQQLHSTVSCRNVEKKIYSKTNEKIPVGFSTSLLKNKEGEIIGAVEAFFDLTKLKQMEEEMMQVKTLAALGELSAVVAHEVKNPLGGIRGFAELLDRDLKEDDPRKRFVKKIVEGVSTLDRIVMSLLDYTKPVKLNPVKVEIVKFLDETINFFKMDAGQAKPNILIDENYPEDNLFCYIDTEQFRQVLLNLFHNAVQAMPEGGRITVKLNQEVATGRVSSKERTKIIALIISDTGMGMNKETKEKLFTPFFTTKERGTGLGLATVKKIVEAHRGEIEVESELGIGTSVIVKLPMTS